MPLVAVSATVSTSYCPCVDMESHAGRDLADESCTDTTRRDPDPRCTAQRYPGCSPRTWPIVRLPNLTGRTRDLGWTEPCWNKVVLEGTTSRPLSREPCFLRSDVRMHCRQFHVWAENNKTVMSPSFKHWLQPGRAVIYSSPACAPWC